MENSKEKLFELLSFGMVNYLKEKNDVFNVDHCVERMMVIIDNHFLDFKNESYNLKILEDRKKKANYSKDYAARNKQKIHDLAKNRYAENRDVLLAKSKANYYRKKKEKLKSKKE